MNRSILGRTAYMAAVGLALAFGAREAMAASQTAAARPYCRDQAHCNQICETIYGPETPGICSSGNTCYCND